MDDREREHDAEECESDRGGTEVTVGDERGFARDDGAERGLPRDAGAEINGLREVGADSHPGREGEGKIVIKAMSSVLMAAVMAVTVTTAACGVPASFKIRGLTARIEAIAVNVVSPAGNSRPTVVWC